MASWYKVKIAWIADCMHASMLFTRDAESISASKARVPRSFHPCLEQLRARADQVEYVVHAMPEAERAYRHTKDTVY